MAASIAKETAQNTAAATNVTICNAVCSRKVLTHAMHVPIQIARDGKEFPEREIRSGNFIHQSFAVLTLTPGPMVEATTQERIYWPFAAAGFALMTAPSRVFRFSVSFSAPKETLPMGQ